MIKFFYAPSKKIFQWTTYRVGRCWWGCGQVSVRLRVGKTDLVFTLNYRLIHISSPSFTLPQSILVTHSRDYPILQDSRKARYSASSWDTLNKTLFFNGAESQEMIFSLLFRQHSNKPLLNTNLLIMTFLLPPTLQTPM